MAVKRLTAGIVPIFNQDDPNRSHIRLMHTDEYGIRTYRRYIPVAKPIEETWLIRPDATVMLYTHHRGGNLIAAYRHKAKRAKA